MKRKSKHHVALRIALLAVVVAMTLAPILASPPPAAYGYPEWVDSRDNVPLSLGWSVAQEWGISGDSAEWALDSGNVGGCTIDIAADGYIRYDLGAVYSVDYLRFYRNGDIDFRWSADAINWGENTDFQGTLGCNFGIVPDMGIGTQNVRYIEVFENTGGASWSFFQVHILGASPTATPYATASPLPPQATACVTATPLLTATPQRTPTPFGSQIPATATKTPTPGGPTAMPTATATGTQPPSFDSGVATFAQSLSPWTVSSPNPYPPYNTEWQSTIGADGQPGVAFMKDYIGYLETTPSVFTTTAPLTGSLAYVRPAGMFFPLRVTGQVKMTRPVAQGETDYIRVWYYDPDYVSAGVGAWVMRPPDWISVSAEWTHFSYSVTQSGGSGKVSAIAISEEFLDAPPLEAGDGVLLDNLRVYSGPLAVAQSYPTCQGSGPGGTIPPPTKICTIKQKPINVFACAQPESLLEIGGWISYLWCNVSTYFSFLPQNRDQIQAIADRQNLSEPVGTLNELDDVFGVLGMIFSGVGDAYETAQYRTVDWSSLLDLSFIDRGFDVPTDTAPSPNEYLGDCPATISNLSQSTRTTACYIIYTLRHKTTALGFAQWGLDILALTGLITYVVQTWFAKNG